MATERMKRKVLKRIRKRIPRPDKIIMWDGWCGNRIRFDWLGDTFLVDCNNKNVETKDVDGRWCYGNTAILLEKLLQ